MLMRSFGAMGSGVMEPVATHKRAGIGCFAIIEFGKMVVI